MTPNLIPRRDFLHLATESCLSLTTILSLSACQTSMKSSTTDHSTTAPSPIIAKSHGPFRILQVTDIHFFADTPEKDQHTIQDLHDLVTHWQPDLLMATGDLWHNNPDGRGREFCEWSASRLSELNIPWAFAWGNHDQMDDYSQGHTIFEKAPHSLYSRGDGHGNYRIEIQSNRSGQPVWDLFVMNSGGGGLTRRERHWIQNETAQTEAIPGIAFCHIPVYQYKTIWDENRARGVMYEDVCYEKDRGAALPALAKTGRVQAMFVGHDHVNDYAGYESDVELVYGRATGYAGYGGDQVEKGGKLIELNLKDGTYSHQTVFADGRVWQPEPSDAGLVSSS